MTITWRTTVPATSTVRYTLDGVTTVVSDNTLTTNHKIVLTNLERYRAYSVVVESTAASTTVSAGPYTLVSR
jgi:hypothetical protein